PAQLNRRGGGVVEGRVTEVGERRATHVADVGEQLDRGAVRADQAGLQVRVVEVADVQLGRHRLDREDVRHLDGGLDGGAGWDGGRQRAGGDDDWHGGSAGGADAAEHVQARVRVRVHEVAQDVLHRRGEDQRVSAAQRLRREANPEGTLGQGRRSARWVGLDRERAVDRANRPYHAQDRGGPERGRVNVAVKDRVDGAGGPVEDQVVAGRRVAGNVGGGNVRPGDNERHGVLVVGQDAGDAVERPRDGVDVARVLAGNSVGILIHEVAGNGPVG